jgi:hypothetical protein
MRILESLSRWSRISKVTYSLVRTFDSVFEPFGPTGAIGKKLPNDEFVIAYMFGVAARFLDFHGTVGMKNSSQVLWKCYARVFPGHGQEILELATARIKAGDEIFMRNVRSGNNEAREYLATKGKSGLPGLTGYLTMRCS